MACQTPPRCIVLRVAARYQRKIGAPVDAILNITAENLEEALNNLVGEIDDLDAAEKELGIDLRSMTKLMRAYSHNDDIHHNGEDVLTHTQWVLSDLAEFTEGMDAERKTVVTLAAALHDLGKAYTYALIDGRSTFRKHAEKSVLIAKVLLAKHRERLGGLYDRILDLIRLHDSFMVLANSREGAKGTHYLAKFMRERVYLDKHLDDLLALSKADSRRAKRYEQSLAAAEKVLEDIAEVERKREAEVQAKAKRQQLMIERRDEIETLLAEVPEAVAAMPDLSAVQEALGKVKRYDLLQQLKSIIG